MPQDVPPAVRMYELLYSSVTSQLLIAVAELGVADHLGDGESRHVDDLAKLTDSHPGSLYRALRALASIGVFTEVEERVFGLTPLAATLRGDADGSMRDLARYVGLAPRQQAFGALLHSVRTGTPAFDHVHGVSWWEYLTSHGELASVFNAAMGNMSQLVNGATLESYDLSGAKHLVDVGGGKGHLVASILKRYPEMTAVVYDLPRVVPAAEEVLRAEGVADRAKCVGGDFLEWVPDGGDLYIVSWTLHDWDDEDSVALLRNIRAVLPADGTLIVIDEVPPPGDAPHFGKFEDIVMLTLLTGHIRTEAELVPLFEAAGLRITEIRPTSSPTSVIVAVPA
ncbi:putative O-methyltransferase YrrM [Actinokineospora baliensis]|uniref:methyltransferase n=1 Tax=Actinokineospora baliensis TaxID=547056 RepID=UPI00195D0843|nr:methyltransferase [Actinokineospora baliensis]MBM7773193.1 putative O-methyltransferase YrrM [Actinokineospora baliensis]